MKHLTKKKSLVTKGHIYNAIYYEILRVGKHTKKVDRLGIVQNWGGGYSLGRNGVIVIGYRASKIMIMF